MKVAAGEDARDAIICEGEGWPLRDADRAYYLKAQIRDVEMFTGATGVSLREDDHPVVSGTWHLGIGRLSVWPTPDDSAWWSERVREQLGPAWSRGDDGYAAILAEVAVRLLTRAEVDQLSEWLDEAMGDFLTCSKRRVITLNDDLLLPGNEGPCCVFDRWESYSLPFRSGGMPYRLLSDAGYRSA